MKLSENAFWQSSIILISLLFALMWNKSPLASYATQLIAVFVFLYLYLALSKKSKERLGEYTQSLQITMLLTIATLLVLSTGGLSSPLFFLVYFVPFAVSLIFKPQTIFLLAIGLVGILLLDTSGQNLVKNLPILGSILFLSPLAYYFGKAFQKPHAQINTDVSADEVVTQIDRDVEQIITREKDKLSTQSIQNLGNIVEQGEKLKNT